MARGALVRNRLREEVNAAVTIQACWRRFVEERKYRQIRNTVLAIQAAYRGRDYRNQYVFFSSSLESFVSNSTKYSDYFATGFLVENKGCNHRNFTTGF